VLAAVALLSVPACRPRSAPTADAGTRESVIKGSRQLMGTVFEVSVTGVDEARGREAVEAALDEVERIEHVLSPVIEDSDVSRINAAAGVAPVRVSGETLLVLDRARDVSERSGGAFDVTFAALSPVWRSLREDPPRLPADDDVEAARALVGWQRLVLDRGRSTAFLERAGMRIDLGGIGQGYGADRAGAVLIARGVESFIVDGSGDLLVRGRKRDGPWRLAIQHPRKRGELLGEVALPGDGALVTSGDYERFVDLGGVRYHHIFDPRTGRPSRGCVAVTLVAPDATLADAMGTAVFVLGPVEGMRLVERTAGVEALIVDEQLRITMSDGMRPLVRLYETR
jgi:thiamine biosynthesis lipoprotein